jgi:hypothetical protein
MGTIFEDKTTMEEALAQWSQRTHTEWNEPQCRDAKLPGQRPNPEMVVKNVIRPRRGFGY